ncbi:hypothetical protein DNTS_011901 [Danionella cerebrum]|uniref:Small VCP/p97-interacting protein n=1 Tax=Danionella cerebrum TaxID=2873325 RepID=A0A553Q7G6_9TELE|nr:hypothetical protein DNTS_011901 [Danionella translucida]
MGLCLPCLSGAEDEVVVTPDPETRRKQLADAAEKRQKERRTDKLAGRYSCTGAPQSCISDILREREDKPTTYRGVKNPEALERKKKKQEETEKQAVSPLPSGVGGLKWQVG